MRKPPFRISDEDSLKPNCLAREESHSLEIPDIEALPFLLSSHMPNKITGTTVPLRRLICAFVVGIGKKRFSYFEDQISFHFQRV